MWSVDLILTNILFHGFRARSFFKFYPSRPDCLILDLQPVVLARDYVLGTQNKFYNTVVRSQTLLRVSYEKRASDCEPLVNLRKQVHNLPLFVGVVIQLIKSDTSVSIQIQNIQNLFTDSSLLSRIEIALESHRHRDNFGIYKGFYCFQILRVFYLFVLLRRSSSSGIDRSENGLWIRRS
jgi:hypothetical protein